MEVEIGELLDQGHQSIIIMYRGGIWNNLLVIHEKTIIYGHADIESITADGKGLLLMIL